MKLKKKASLEQAEETVVKDFFDMILPGAVKFMSDHYICGNSFWCVWAVREYPPSSASESATPRYS